MRTIVITIICCLAFMALGYAEDTEEPQPVEEKSICPKTKISDNNQCMRCHTEPDWKVKESEPWSHLELPGFSDDVRVVDGSTLYLRITGIQSDHAVRFFNYVYAHPQFKKVIIEVQSAGGGIFDGWRIVGHIEEARARGIEIETRCYSYELSFGFVIFAAGDIGKRFVSPTAELMTHELWSMTMFDFKSPSKNEDEAEVFRHLQDTINNWLITRCTNPEMTKEKLDNLIRHKDYWINGKETVELGFADGFIGQ